MAWIAKLDSSMSICWSICQVHSLVISDLCLETKDSWFKSGYGPFAEVKLSAVITWLNVDLL